MRFMMNDILKLFTKITTSSPLLPNIYLIKFDDMYTEIIFDRYMTQYFTYFNSFNILDNTKVNLPRWHTCVYDARNDISDFVQYVTKLIASISVDFTLIILCAKNSNVTGVLESIKSIDEKRYLYINPIACTKMITNNNIYFDDYSDRNPDIFDFVTECYHDIMDIIDDHDDTIIIENDVTDLNVDSISL